MTDDFVKIKELESITFKLSREKFVLFKKHCVDSKISMSDVLRKCIDTTIKGTKSGPGDF
jgi:hypothetical protein